MLYSLARAIALILTKCLYRMQVEGKENIPGQGPFMICANHIKWFDPVAVGAAFPRRLKICFMSKQELFRNSVIAYFLGKLGAFPVNREAADYAAFRRALQILNEGGILGIFPEGTRSKTGELKKAQNGAALIAGRCSALIVPVAVIGPYRLGHPLKIIIGPPFELPTLEYQSKAEKKEILEQRSTEIMERIKNLFPLGD